MPNKTGYQFQAIGDPQRILLRATWPHTLKMLQGGKSLDLAREWRAHRPDGVLVLRYVTADNEPLSQLPFLTDRALLEFDGYQSVGGRVVCEVPVNERFHTDPADFVALAEASLVSATTIKKAGFTPGVLVTSEGNPPGDNYGAGFFLQPRVLECMLSFRAMGAIWCPHGYSHPPDPSDEPYHSTRPPNILRQLPEPARLNYLYGEDGCDGGTQQPNRKPGRGWKDYFDTPAAYAAWYRAKSHALAADPLCVGSAIFLSGYADAAWQSFDIADEVDVRWIFTEDVPGPPIQWLQPTAAIPPEEQPVADVVLSVPTRTAHAADGNWGKGESFGPCRGVVVHSTGGSASTLETEYVGTVNWGQNPDAGVSWHRLIGAGKFAEVCTTVHDHEKAYHAREPANTNRRGIEFAHPDGPSWEAVQYPAFQYEAAGELIARWKLADEKRGWVWPLKLLTRAQAAADAPGVVLHRDLPAGIADGKRDPTPPFDGAKLIAAAVRWYAAISGGSGMPPTPTAPTDVNALRDQTYALAHQLRALKPAWQAAGYPQTAEGIDAAGNAAERFVSTSKGER